MKEKNAFVLPINAFELSQKFTKTYEMPCGNIYELEKEFATCGEVLFAPVEHFYEGFSLAEMVEKALGAAPVDCRKTLRSNIVVAGGTSTLRGVRIFQFDS